MVVTFGKIVKVRLFNLPITRNRCDRTSEFRAGPFAHDPNQVRPESLTHRCAEGQNLCTTTTGGSSEHRSRAIWTRTGSTKARAMRKPWHGYHTWWTNADREP